MNRNPSPSIAMSSTEDAENKESHIDPLLGSLGMQSAHLVSVLDRWFAATNDKLDRITGELTRSVDHSASNGTSSAARIPQPAVAEAIADGRAVFAGDPHIQFPSFQRRDPLPVAVPLLATTIASIEAEAGWEGWGFHQSVQMLEGGVVELRQDRSTPGVTSPPVKLSVGGLLRITIEHELMTENAVRLTARVVDEANRHLGPEVELTGESTETFWFASHRSRNLKVFVIALAPVVGARFKIRRVHVEAVNSESYFDNQRMISLAPSIASMASIPARREMLHDCVDSLLLQCDAVRVFLNNYEDVPDFLTHPRVEVRRSQDWDDKGDAGKFGWINNGDAPGYRIIVDDDLIFPPDFVNKISESVNSYGNRAIVAMHGVLLKQPVTNYYDPESRTVFHFQSGLRHDRTCHVLGTNALCYYSEAVVMKWHDFQFRNMADIFLARYAQEHGLPMVTLARQPFWVRQNTVEGGFDTIYESSLKKTKSNFDSSMVQDSLVKWIAPLTLQRTNRTKIVLIMLGTEAASFREALESFQKTRWLDFDWAVIVAAISDDESVISSVVSAKCADEIHIVHPSGSSACERVEAAVALARKIGFDMLMLSTDDVRFLSGHWTRNAAAAFASNPKAVVFASRNASGDVVLSGQSHAQSSFVLVSPLLLEEVGPPDVCSAVNGWTNFNSWLSALEQAGAQVAALPNEVSAQIMKSLQIGPSRPLSIVGKAAESAPIEPAWLRNSRNLPVLTINGFFEGVFYINLDRRPDRRDVFVRRLSAAGISAERVEAIDGRDPSVAAEFLEYTERPLISDISAVRRIKSSKEYYQDYDSEMARVAYVEGKQKKKAIQSAGAWGYLKTWERILERVLRERLRSALVFDDDVVFHKNTREIFGAAAFNLPSDWKVLQLGTLQYEWSEDWMTWHNQVLYRTNGSAVGSHAVGFHFDVAPFLLEHVRRMLLPFDTGALAMATLAFANQSFVIYPNIAIQALDDASDINTSDFQKATERARAAEVYRWDLQQYTM